MPSMIKNLFPNDPAERKLYPIFSGFLSYFPSAVVAVSHHIVEGNAQHNLGSELYWDRSKSTDHLDCAIRHSMEGDLVAAAWRILAALQMKLEAEGAPIAPAARNCPVQSKTAAQIAIEDGYGATGVSIENYLLGDKA